MNRLPPLTVLEKAIRERDPAFDGVFFIAVRTTGIFCRPSCAAKTTLIKNREYFVTAKEAIFAGYRPCKRCRPLDTDGRPPKWLTGLVAEVEGDPGARISDTDLRGRGIDPARVRRYFLKQYGMTFQAYCRGRRLGEALRKIRKGVGVDDVALGHGYESLSGFRDAFLKTFGQPPGQARTTADCIVTTWVESPLGPLLAGARPEGICLLEFTDRRALEAQFATVRTITSTISRTNWRATSPVRCEPSPCRWSFPVHRSRRKCGTGCSRFLTARQCRTRALPRRSAHPGPSEPSAEPTARTASAS
jgi:AraC family transcriptional regulator of adaptative response/methylated-DNA-[protein]-cysteine methyltransferase